MQLFDPGQIGINALAAFKAGREEREKRDYKNALAGYATNPSEQGLSALAPHNPEFVMKERERMQKIERERMIGEIGGRALRGDLGAMEKLFTVDPDLYMRLDTRQRDELKRTNGYMGQAAMQIGKLPEEQRPQAWAAAVQQAEAGGMDIPDYLEAYNPNSLDTAVRMAGIVENYIKQFEPRYQAIPEGGTLVDTRNPQAVQSYMSGMGGRGPQPGAIEEGYRFKGGNPADPSSWEPVGQGGPTQPASATFRP